MRTSVFVGALLLVLSALVAAASAAPILSDRAPGPMFFTVSAEGFYDALAAGAHDDWIGSPSNEGVNGADFGQTAGVSLGTVFPMAMTQVSLPGSILGPVSVAMFGTGLFSLLSLYPHPRRR
jgi:hypothetical protein